MVLSRHSRASRSVSVPRALLGNNPGRWYRRPLRIRQRHLNKLTENMDKYDEDSGRRKWLVGT